MFLFHPKPGLKSLLLQIINNQEKVLMKVEELQPKIDAIAAGEKQIKDAVTGFEGRVTQKISDMQQQIADLQKQQPDNPVVAALSASLDGVIADQQQLSAEVSGELAPAPTPEPVPAPAPEPTV